jgi:hypothetical protein
MALATSSIMSEVEFVGYQARFNEYLRGSSMRLAPYRTRTWRPLRYVHANIVRVHKVFAFLLDVQHCFLPVVNAFRVCYLQRVFSLLAVVGLVQHFLFHDSFAMIMSNIVLISSIKPFNYFLIKCRNTILYVLNCDMATICST